MMKHITLFTLMVLAGACHGTRKDCDALHGDDATKVEIISLQYAKAIEVAEILNGIYDSWPRIAADQRSNSIVVRGTLKEIERARRLIETLDRELKEE